MSELTNEINQLYPMKYNITRHEVHIYDKNLSEIGKAPIGSSLILKGRVVNPDGEIMQVLAGSDENIVFLIKDSEFAGGDSADVIANDIETNTEETVAFTEFHATARVKDTCTSLYGPGDEYYQFNRLQKGQRVIISGRVAMIYPIRSWVAVYQRSKKSNELRYLGFVDESTLIVDTETEPVVEAAPEPKTVEEKVDALVEMNEGPEKEAVKKEVRDDILSQDILVYAFRIDSEIKRKNVMKHIGELLVDGCAVCEEGSASTYAELVASGFSKIPTDYKNTLYAIIPNAIAPTLKKRMIAQGLKPIITKRG